MWLDIILPSHAPAPYPAIRSNKYERNINTHDEPVRYIHVYMYHVLNKQKFHKLPIKLKLIQVHRIHFI